ncbi:MAG TPA: helix-turn-helix domain-containing protein [Oscillospiraceae bacterium]|nr:helix-turn-helix domain-containing protein [Oscillospiraceae bacterium]
MENDILNLEQVVSFLGVSEKTLIKLLREEHIPARKIGREWRFSKEALVHWLAAGDSADYINQNERYMISKDVSGSSDILLDKIDNALSDLKTHENNIKILLHELDRDIIIPDDATLRVSYKQQRNVEKLEFKVFWDLREDVKLESNQNAPSAS